MTKARDIANLGDSLINDADDNVALGDGALDSQTTGTNNVAIGESALASVTTASDNTAIGYQAATATTGGENTAVGKRAMYSNTSGQFNSSLGLAALFSNSSGYYNTALGHTALGNNTTASHNTAAGFEAGRSNTTGTYNQYFGHQAGYTNTTGARNVGMGHTALYYNTGSDNTAIGHGAGSQITSGSENTILGGFDGNQDNTDIRTSNSHIAISNGGGSVRALFNQEGYVKFKPVSSIYYSMGGAYHEFNHNNNDTSALLFYQQHGSFVNDTIFMQNQRTQSSNYGFAQFRSGAGSDIEFRLRGDGNAYADGSWSGGGADYAEYFEWADGNTSNQDRTGYTVVLDNEKIRLATSDDSASSIIGAVSVNPSVIGDTDIDAWKQKYQKDDFGAYVKETYTMTEWTETVIDQEAADEVLDDEGNVVTPAQEEITREVLHNYESDKIPDGLTVPDDAVVSTEDANGNIFERRILNPDYDPNLAYVSREDRPEWATIGMMGKLRIRTGQPVGDRWIKMRDVSDTVEEWLVR